jgi:hypothetical protein
MSDSEIRDALPEELDVTLARPYQVPDTKRRRIAAAIYVIVAVLAAGAYAWTENPGMLAAAALLAVIAAYHWLAGWHLQLDETAALAGAAGAVGFPVGHASAQLAWRGLRSRPTWRVLLYSADEPPTKRGLVELDALDGAVLGQYTEDNPEDWSIYGFGSDPVAAPPSDTPA